MSYVGKMKDLIELYLAELERDGICYLTVTNELNGSCAISTAQAKELLTDFAQWLEDDVQDDETVDGLSADTVLIDDAAELNLTGFGDIVDSPVENWDMPSQEEQNKPFDVADWAAKRRQYIQRLRADSAFGYLRAIERNESMFDKVVEDSLIEEDDVE